ncbi:hypothetical protein HPP92_010515 [Vanilla planifolia]|uniref:WW domain-containing protein n=1 Tax=Vanilla planifolia TaxID=51239 RepID=A0A835R3X4_VANPL|nr:hypothetical protein HPP92_010515 [Vanilla planifolia]
MAAAEAAQTSLDPSFAPEDPSLPKPWKGLIDGSTGVLYYWNPETNVTQYEKPAGSAPPVPPGPPLASTLQLAPVITSNSTPSNGPSSQQPTEQQTFQQPFEHVQQLQQNQLQPSVQQIPLQQLHQQPYQQLQSVQGQPPLQISQQPSQQYSHLQHLPFHQAPYIQGQNISRPQGQFQYQPGPHAFQFPYQQGQQPKSLQPLVGQELNESQAAHQLGQQLQGSQQSEQQVQRLQASNAMHEPGQKSVSNCCSAVWDAATCAELLEATGHASTRPTTFSATVAANWLSKSGGQWGSSSLLQQTANHLLPGLTSQAHTPQSGVNIIQPQQQSPIKPSSGMDQAHQAGLKSSHHQVQTGSPLFPNQMSHSMGRPSVVSKCGYAEDPHERRGADFYSSGRSEGPMIIPDMRVGASGLPPSFPTKFSNSGHPGGLPSHGPPNMYGNAAFAQSTSVGPHPRMFGAPDSPNISADAYGRHHEVTAMGDNIPASFMTFEATGFPPEIMREVL